MQEDKTPKLKATFRNHFIVVGILIFCITLIILGLLAKSVMSNKAISDEEHDTVSAKTADSEKSAFGKLSIDENSGSFSGKAIDPQDSLHRSTQNSTITMYTPDDGEEVLYSYSGEVIQLNAETREVTLLDKETGHSSTVVISEKVKLPLPYQELTQEEIIALEGKDPLEFDISAVKVGDYLQYVKYFESVILD